jgi:hypothetical protein
MKLIDFYLLLILITLPDHSFAGKEITWPEKVKVVLENTKHLEYSRGNRLPLYLWSAKDLGDFDDETAEILVDELNKRGIGIVCSWNKNEKEKSISRGLAIAKAQNKLGLKVNIDATSLLYSFYVDDEKFAHVDEDGNPFFDDSFGRSNKMGCPFTLDSRKDEIRDRVDYFLRIYKEEGLSVDFIFADWEIDGPIEVNHAYESSKECIRCRKYLGENFSFEEFQKKMREMRSYLQYYSYSSPVINSFPDALVGNYAVYPNDGYRYWYDYFEFLTDSFPHITEQKAPYRKWYNDFPLTGYTFAMPVVYPWWQIFRWYDFENTDYRWFYNMLLNAGNAGKSTPCNIPIISFVHYNTVFSGSQPDHRISQMTENTYQELLWHMLLRGTDTFFMWSGKDDFPAETRLVHEVYAAAQEYGEFLEKGWPITFDLPNQPGVVVSGLALDGRVLIRRTDFGEDHLPVELLVGTKSIRIEYAPGICKIYDL